MDCSLPRGASVGAAEQVSLPGPCVLMVLFPPRPEIAQSLKWQLNTSCSVGRLESARVQPGVCLPLPLDSPTLGWLRRAYTGHSGLSLGKRRRWSSRCLMAPAFARWSHSGRTTHRRQWAPDGSRAVVQERRAAVLSMPSVMLPRKSSGGSASRIIQIGPQPRFGVSPACFCLHRSIPGQGCCDFGWRTVKDHLNDLSLLGLTWLLLIRESGQMA